MKITIANLINSIAPVLSKMMSKELSPVTSFKLVKMVKAVNAEIEIFNGERIKLLEKYGTKSEDKSDYIIPDENKDAFNKGISELLALEVDIAVEKVNLANEDIKISPADMMKIEEFVEM